MAQRPVRRPDETDRRILATLQEDARLPLPELAARIGISRSAAYSRFDRLRADGVITGFTTVVDPEALGYSTAALILVNIEQHSWRAVRIRLAELPGVEYVAATSGAFDFALLVRVPDVATLRDVLLDKLHSMAEVRSTQTVFILDEQHCQLGPA